MDAEKQTVDIMVIPLMKASKKRKTQIESDAPQTTKRELNFLICCLSIP